jgi:hypothetical protein
MIEWNEGQRLEWVDFLGNVNDSSSYDAESFAEIRYNYTFNTTRGFFFHVYANFNKNASWSRKEFRSFALLKHEQLHFDIAELYARKMKEAFENYNYTENYREEIAQIFNEKKLEYHLMQLKYDEQTSHSLDKEKQQEWELLVNRELSNYDKKYISGKEMAKK